MKSTLTLLTFLVLGCFRPLFAASDGPLCNHYLRLAGVTFKGDYQNGQDLALKIEDRVDYSSDFRTLEFYAYKDGNYQEYHSEGYAKTDNILIDPAKGFYLIDVITYENRVGWNLKKKYRAQETDTFVIALDELYGNKPEWHHREGHRWLKKVTLNSGLEVTLQFKSNCAVNYYQ